MRDHQPDELKYVNRYITCNKSNFTVESHRFKRKTMYAGNNFLCMIPPPIRSEDKKNIFKKNLKCLLINKALHSLDELNSNEFIKALNLKVHG